MSWIGIANNQTVSLDNLKDAVATGVFLQLTTIPTGTKQVTKSEASTYVNCATYYAPFASKSSNQLVVKSDLRGRVVIPISLAWDTANVGSLDIYTASPASGSFTLQTTLTASGALGTTSTTISLLDGDGLYVILTHTARATSGQRGQIFQILNGTSTEYRTTAGTVPTKTVTSATWTLSSLNTYSIQSNLGNLI